MNKRLLIGLYSFIIIFLLLFSTQVVSAQEKINPVIWKTAYNEFSSSNFYIDISGQRFYGNDDVRVSSDPGLDKTTLELNWTENSVPMRLYFYFEKIDNGMWQLYDLRTYNATGSDWIYYGPNDSLGNPVKSLIGHRDFYADREFFSKSGIAKIHCDDCSITAFMSNALPPSIHGYTVDFRIGLVQNETITISNDPMTGYGVNAVLLDSSGEVVKDQSDFSYNWKAENDSILTLLPQSVDYPDGNCAYGVLAPCPKFNVQIKGKNPGITRVILDVIRNSDKTVVASNAFSVKVIDKKVEPSLSPTPSNNRPTPTPTPDNSNVTGRLEELEGEVGNLTEQLHQQQQQIGILQKIVNSIQSFLQRLFRF